MYMYIYIYIYEYKKKKIFLKNVPKWMDKSDQNSVIFAPGTPLAPQGPPR